MRKKLVLLSSVLMSVGALCATGIGAPEDKEITILFTHDIHDYFYPALSVNTDGTVSQHGGAAKLATLIKENSSDSSIYVDAGDFSMGTYLQAGYNTNAYELSLLGALGCEVTTFGNHEFDYGAKGISEMLNVATKFSVRPEIVCANYSLEGELSEDQKLFKAATENYGVKDYIIKNVDGIKVAFIGFMGDESISDAPTSGQVWTDYIDCAKATVKEIGNQADVIVALSHSGTSGDGKNGEDIELAKAVPDIDLIISGHSHTSYSEPITVGNTIIGSQGCYLENLGKVTLAIKDGQVTCKDYKLLRIDDSVKDDAEMAKVVDSIKLSADETYLQKYGFTADEVLTTSDFSFTSLSNMYATHQEYPMGDLIADSYRYEAEKNGINDIDVFLVGLGTIRGTFPAGDITVANAFETCSLGVGADGSAGHPLVSAYITGKELKLLVELDASLGPMVSSIKMNYNGLKYTFNDKRIILDRVTDVNLMRGDTPEKIEDGKLYKVCCNMYAANMLGMLNGLTKGILSISIKDANGNPVDDLYTCSLKNTAGQEIKEWVAMSDYLKSFEDEKLPTRYADSQGRKNKVSEGGLVIFAHPGLTTILVIVVPIALIAIIITIVLLVRKNKKKKAQK